MGSTALVRRRQLEAADGDLGLERICEMVNRKIENQVDFLKKLMYSRPDSKDYFTPFIEIIEDAGKGLAFEGCDLEDVRNRIMGLEGTAGRATSFSTKPIALPIFS